MKATGVCDYCSGPLGPGTVVRPSTGDAWCTPTCAHAWASGEKANPSAEGRRARKAASEETPPRYWWDIDQIRAEFTPSGHGITPPENESIGFANVMHEGRRVPVVLCPGPTIADYGAWLPFPVPERHEEPTTPSQTRTIAGALMDLGRYWSRVFGLSAEGHFSETITRGPYEDRGPYR